MSARLTPENAPVGTIAPSIYGTQWERTADGWKWVDGSIWPRLGGDWNGKLIAPAPALTDAQFEQLVEDIAQCSEHGDNHGYAILRQRNVTALYNALRPYLSTPAPVAQAEQIAHYFASQGGIWLGSEVAAQIRKIAGGAAPVAQEVPEEITSKNIERAPSSFSWDEAGAWALGWNACRAEVLRRRAAPPPPDGAATPAGAVPDGLVEFLERLVDSDNDYLSSKAHEFLFLLTEPATLPQPSGQADAARVRSALEPFAAIAAQYAPQEDDSFSILADFPHGLTKPPTLGQCRAARAVLDALDAAPLPQAKAQEPTCRMKPFYTDPVDEIAYQLAAELEAAELSANDFVTVNREKLKGIARKVLEFAAPASSSAEPGHAETVMLTCSNGVQIPMIRKGNGYIVHPRYIDVNGAVSSAAKAARRSRPTTRPGRRRD